MSIRVDSGIEDEESERNISVNEDEVFHDMVKDLVGLYNC